MYVIQVGSMCMGVVEHELKRHRQLLDDLAKKRRNCILVSLSVLFTTAS